MTAPAVTKTNLLSLLVHGPSKVGKSTLTSTSPTPILVLDAEGSWRFIRQAGFRSGVPLRRVEWDGVNAPPRADGTWDVCVVPTTSWVTVTQIYAWLTQAPHDFATIVLDSITELQRKCRNNIAADGVIQNYQGWGKLLADMDRVIRGFRDLTLAPGPVQVAIFVAETAHRDGKWRPHMQGQIANSLPYWVDVNGYMYQAPEIGVDGVVGPNRTSLWIAQTPEFETGERVQGMLPDVLHNPSITDMLRMIYPTETQADTSNGETDHG